MKFSLVILTVALFNLVVSEYNEVPPEAYLEEQVIENSLNFGADFIIKQAIAKDVLPEGNYEIADLTKVEQQLLKNGVDYRFHVHITSTQGVNVNGRFTVYYRYSTKAFKMVSQHYKYRYPSKLNDLENGKYIWKNFDFNIPSEELKEENESQEEVTKMFEATEEEYEIPEEETSAEENEGLQEEGPIEEEITSPSEEYEIQGTEFPGEEAKPTSEEMEYPGEEKEFIDEENRIQEEEDQIPEEEHETPEEESKNPPLKGYVEVAPEDYLENSIIERALNFGGNYTIKQAISRNVLPEGNYKIIRLTQVEQQSLKNEVDYRFYVHITSTQGVNVNGRFTVYYRYSTKAFKVVSQHYSYKYPSKLNDLRNEKYFWEEHVFEN